MTIERLSRSLAAVLLGALLFGTLLSSGSVRSDSTTTGVIAVAGEVQMSPSPRALAASCVQITAPATNLASVVAGQPAGTCFRLGNGTYRFHDVVPKDRMSFIGESTDGVVVDGRGRENAFHGTADQVSIANMTFQDFDSSAGHKRQEQSPIRGTAAIWASNRGQMATNWTIDNIVSQRNYAAGIFVGDHFTVRNSIFRDNGVTGLSGDSFVGGIFENNVVHGNGALQLSGVYVNGGGMKFGQAGSVEHPVVVRNNEVYDNPSTAIWCDIGCAGFHVIDNYIHDQVSRAVYYELSSNLLVRGNTILRSNTWTSYTSDFNAGAITVAESRDAVIENNYIEDAKAGVIIRQTRRPASGEGFLRNYPYVVWTASNVVVQNNVLARVGSMGISTGSTGVGLIADPNSISFIGNTYDDANGMSFWWNNGQRLSAAQWRAAGRDAVANGSAPSTPDTTPRGPSGTPAVPTAPSPVQETPTPEVTPQTVNGPATIPLRINAGGPRLVDGRGAEWIEDSFFLGGNTASHAAGVGIENTTDDALYRNERWGAVGYDIPVPNGDYVVRLHHAEVYEGCQAATCRTFSVTVEGDEVVTDLDVYREAGGYSAFVIDSTQTVDDGVLSIRFSSSRQEPQVSGIEVLPATQEQAIGNEGDSGPTAGTASPDAAGTGASDASRGSAPDDSASDSTNEPTSDESDTDATDGAGTDTTVDEDPATQSAGEVTVGESARLDDPDRASEPSDGGAHRSVDAPPAGMMALEEVQSPSSAFSGTSLLLGTGLALAAFGGTVAVRRRRPI